MLTPDQRHRHLAATRSACVTAAAHIAALPASERSDYLLLIFRGAIDPEVFEDLRDDVLSVFDELDDLSNEAAQTGGEGNVNCE